MCPELPQRLMPSSALFSYLLMAHIYYCTSTLDIGIAYCFFKYLLICSSVPGLSRGGILFAACGVF